MIPIATNAKKAKAKPSARQASANRSAAAKRAAATRRRQAEEEAAAQEAEERRKAEEEAAPNSDSNSEPNADAAGQAEGNDGEDNNSGETEEKLPSQISGEKVGPRREPLSYKPNRAPLKNAGLDQHAAEEKRQAELDAEREEHNRRTGDASRA